MSDSRRSNKMTLGLGGTVKRTGSLLKFGTKKGKNREKAKSTYDPVGNGNAELQKQIDSWSDREVEEKFDEMLTDMNLTSDNQKAPLRMKTMQEKRKMLTMQYRGNALQKSSTNMDTPVSFIEALTNRELSGKQRLDLLKQLRVSLTSNTVTWVMEYGPDGLEAILDNLNTCLLSTSERKSALECVRCLKAFMNSKFGLKALLHHESALTILSRAIDVKDPATMLETVRLMAAVCLVPPDGHKRVLEGITDFSDLRQSEDRFSAIIKGMTEEYNTTNTNLRTACLQLTNAIISNPDELEFRLHLRNEFWRSGLIDLIDMLEADEQEAVCKQTRILFGHKEDDAEDFSSRFDNIRFEFDEQEECYRLISNQVLNTHTEPYFLSILQHLLFIREDPTIKLQYYQLIEECVTQIVMHRSGVDPDFRKTQKFEIDVEPLIGNIIEKTKEDGMIGGVEREKLEKALTAKQETEAKVSNLENKVKCYEMEIADLKNKVSDGIGAAVSGALQKAGPGGSGVPPPPGGFVGGVPSGVPPPPPPPGGFPGVPPPPPPPGGFPGVPPPPPPPGGLPGVPPPPPPPGGFPGGAPPPPPLPGMGPPPPPGGGPPPPPPPPGAPGAPPPPGAPRPPGAPGAPAPFAFAAQKRMPDYIKPKKKYATEKPTKRANWEPIKPQDISEDSFWTKCNEDALGDEDLFATLSNKFSSKPLSKKKADDGDTASIKSTDSGQKKASKKSKQLRILDPKSGQGLSILLGSIKIPYEEIKRRILQVDEESLTQSFVEQLIKILPEPELLNTLAELKPEYDDLAEPEQFLVCMSSVKRLGPRLNSILFKMRFDDIIGDIKPDIVSATAACEEVKQSGKFKQLLELILLIGNYMNAGSKKEQTVGFQMNFLTKLENTKTQDQKQTLLHFIAETVENKFPHLIDYSDELLHIDAAARVSDEVLLKNLGQMSSQLRNLQTDIKNVQNQKNVDENDRFLEVMSEFVNLVKEQNELLSEMHDKMQQLYRGLAKYYCFDVKKYTIDEFFGDLKSFKEKFNQAVKENVKLRETEEKIKRVKEAKEKAETEKREKIARKKQLVDLSQDDDGEGVMDNLLDALQMGTAFNVRDGGRKRTPRTTGAERRAQLQKSRSRVNVTGSTELNVPNSNSNNEETPKRPERRRNRNSRPADSMMPEEFEDRPTDLMNKLRAL